MSLCGDPAVVTILSVGQCDHLQNHLPGSVVFSLGSYN